MGVAPRRNHVGGSTISSAGVIVSYKFINAVKWVKTCVSRWLKTPLAGAPRTRSSRAQQSVVEGCGGRNTCGRIPLDSLCSLGVSGKNLLCTQRLRCGRNLRYYALILLVSWALSAHAQSTIYFTRGGFGKLFDRQDARLNRDHLRDYLYLLEDGLRARGYNVVELTDVKYFPDARAIICFDLPNNHAELLKYPKNQRFLFLWEPPVVKPASYANPAEHQLFHKVFTQFDNLVDQQLYFKFYEPQPNLQRFDKLPKFNERKLAVMVASNFKSDHPLSIYSERDQIVNFFEQKIRISVLPPNQQLFMLYGSYGWPRERYRCYQGAAPSKYHCLKQFKFTFCCENMREWPGYITGQKIIPPLLCGSIPVYLGPKNTSAYIPKACYIDYYDFANLAELYAYMTNLTAAEYQAYLAAAQAFLNSAQVYQFSSAWFCENFFREVLDEVEHGY